MPKLFSISESTGLAAEFPVGLETTTKTIGIGAGSGIEARVTQANNRVFSVGNLSWDITDPDSDSIDSKFVVRAMKDGVLTACFEVSNGGPLLSFENVTTIAVTAGSSTVIRCDDDVAGSGIIVTLPAASTSAGALYIIKKLGSTANITIQAAGSDLIDGASTAVLTTQYESVDIFCHGNGWDVQ